MLPPLLHGDPWQQHEDRRVVPADRIAVQVGEEELPVPSDQRGREAQCQEQEGVHQYLML